MGRQLERASFDSQKESLPQGESRLAAEAYVLSKGLSGSLEGFRSAAEDAWQHPGDCAAKIGMTAAFGLAVGFLSRRSGIYGLLGRGVAAAAGLSFCLDGVIPFYNAGKAAWTAESQEGLDRASRELSSGLGKFVFDTVLTAPAAFGGAVAGAHLPGGAVKGAGKPGLLRAGSPAEAAGISAPPGEGAKVAEPGYHFKAFSSRISYVPRFDFGVEITERRFLNGQPNLDHHGPNYTYKDLSASEQALQLPLNQLPPEGSRIATVRFDSDSATAMAVLANRKSGRAVNAEVVDFVGQRDRGLAAERPDNQSISLLIDALDQIVLDAKKNYVKDLDGHIRRIQSVLDSTIAPEDLTRLSGIRQRSMLRGDERFALEAPVTVVVPDKLLQVSYDSAVGIPKAQHYAPVVVFENTSVGRVTVAGRPDSPASMHLARALKELNKLEPGWEGRDNIFGNMTKMTPEQVSSIVARYVDPPPVSRFVWALEDRWQSIKLPSVKELLGRQLEWGKLLQPAAVASLPSMLFDKHLPPVLAGAH